MKRCSIAHRQSLMDTLSHKSVFEWVTDDSVPDTSYLESKVRMLLTTVNIYVLSPRDDAFIIFVPMSNVMYDIHMAYIEGNDRKYAMRDAIEATLWMMNFTDAMKFITHVPVTNKHASWFARRCGMKKEGHLKDAFMKNEILHDIEIYGATCSEILRKKEGL